MDDIENLMNKIQDYLGSSTDNLKILEEQIDIGIQMDYYKSSGKVKNKLNKKKVLADKDLLFNGQLTLTRQKTLLCKLASIDDVTAFRTIEKFLQTAGPEIYKWAFLACQESKMLLESSLLNENIVFISTGLGGKEGKLRYHIIFFSETLTELGDFHKKIITTESDHVFKKYGCVSEKLEVVENFCSIVALIPLKAELKKLFELILAESNIYGNFLKESYIVSNVKILSNVEIKNIIKNKLNAPEELFEDTGSED